MNKIKRIMICAGLLAMSGNAAAIIMNSDGTQTMEYSDYTPFIQDVIDGMYNVTNQDERRSVRVAKTQNKLNRKLIKLDNLDPDAKNAAKKERKLDRRVTRLQTKIAKVMTRMDIMSRQPGGGNHGSIPEPSTIALLGLGLVGIGAARSLRRKAR